MDEKEKDHYQKELMSLRKEQTVSARALRDGLRSTLTESIGELSLYDNHPADIGDATFEREKDLGLKLFTEDQLRKIDDALKRLDDGEYGICEICGKEIEKERLEAIPYTTLCTECKKVHEDDAVDFHRPVEEKILDLPYGGNNADENNAFDGEDSWEAVARFGTSNSPPELKILGEED